MRLGQHILGKGTHGRISCFCAAECKEVSPFTQVRFHYYTTCCGVWQYFARLLCRFSLTDQTFIDDFCIAHRCFPPLLGRILLILIPLGANEGNIARLGFLDIALGFNAERGLPVSGLFSHDSTGCCDIKCQITEFLRRTMPAAHLPALKSVVAVFGDPVVACVAVSAGKFAVFCHLQTVNCIGVQLLRALLNYDHQDSSFLLRLRARIHRLQ